MSALGEFLRMGGYGNYVWSAYALAAVVLIANVLLPQRSERQALQRLRQRHQTRHDYDATT